MVNSWKIYKAKLYLSPEEYEDLVCAANNQDYVTDDEYSYEISFPDGNRMAVGLYSYWDENDEDIYETMFYSQLLNARGLVIAENDSVDADKEAIDDTWIVSDYTTYTKYYAYIAVKDNQVLIA